MLDGLGVFGSSRCNMYFQLLWSNQKGGRILVDANKKINLQK